MEQQTAQADRSPGVGRLLTLTQIVRQFAHIDPDPKRLRGRLQVAYWRGLLPGRKLESEYRNSPLLLRAADVERYLTERQGGRRMRRRRVARRVRNRNETGR